MKYILILIFMISINTCLFSQVLSENGKKGLYFDFSVMGRYIPADGIVKTSLYYRLPIFKSDNYFLKNTWVDFGAENIFGLNANKVKVFSSVKPLSFFKLRASIGYISYYKTAKHTGFSVFDNDNQIKNYNDFINRQGGKADGVIVELNPSIKINIYKFTFISDLNISFAQMNKGPYYYDDISFLIRKQKDFSYVFSAYFMFNIFPINVGLCYNINNTSFARNIGQILGVVGAFEHHFSDRVNLYTIFHAGEYLIFDYLSYQLFISFEIGVRYKIL